MRLKLIGTNEESFVYEDEKQRQCSIRTLSQPWTFSLKTKHDEIKEYANKIVEVFIEKAMAFDDRELEEKIKELVV